MRDGLGAGPGGDVLELDAVVAGKRHQRRDVVAAGRRPMDVVQLLVLAQRAMRTAVLQEELQLLEARIFRRAKQPRHRERAAGIGPGGGGLQALAAEPAAQQARHEGISGAEHIVDLDRKALADDAVLKVVADGTVIDDAAHGAALQDDGGGRMRADGLEGAKHVVGARRNHDLFLSPDDQVAIAQNRSQPR